MWQYVILAEHKHVDHVEVSWVPVSYSHMNMSAGWHGNTFLGEEDHDTFQ